MSRRRSKFRFSPLFSCLLAGLVLFAWAETISARAVSRTISVISSGAIPTGLSHIAEGSDILLCGGLILTRDSYTLDYISGLLTLKDSLPCDSIIIRAYQIPPWMAASAGNRVTPGQKFISFADDSRRENEAAGTAREISLSGNKSFSFIVGRSGEGYFSQGLNVEVDALLADNLRLRGAVSDRIGSNGNGVATSGFGGTTSLAELDKYFFELSGSRFTARAGDINSISSTYLPKKRIKGLQTEYTDAHISASADIGRPAGRYNRNSLMGSDGKQGPYQIRGPYGLPAGIVPGSETVYVDGRELEGGAGKYYTIDYPAGRITFAPRLLITAQSRIEVDFEVSSGDYEQEIYDISNTVRVFDGKLLFEVGARRESDNKNRLRFAALSPDDIAVLSDAGDNASRAYISGVTADTNGFYVRQVDSTGAEYYRYSQSGGDYAVLYTFVGDGVGEYVYVGDGIYEYAGPGKGAYNPIIYLPLPSRNDLFFASLITRPYQKGRLSLSYQGNHRDDNLFSSRDDGDNNKGLLETEFRHDSKIYKAAASFRFKQANFLAVKRLYEVDNIRLWALPIDSLPGDESRLMTSQRYATNNNELSVTYGYLSYKDYLQSHRFSIDGALFKQFALSPYGSFASADSRDINDNRYKGNYERQAIGVIAKPLRRVTLETGYNREFLKNAYGDATDTERFTQYHSRALYRQTVVELSRREEFYSDSLGRKGPQQDKVQISSQESIGRLRLSASGTLLDQRALDSDRSDRTERLFEAALRYLASGGWLSLQATYRQNRQTGGAIGYGYIFVGSGQGDYRLDGGQYLPDPDGEYIRITETRGESQSLSVGEKSHSVIVYPGRMAVGDAWKRILSQMAFRLKTEIIEEMPGKDNRRLSWLLPWQSTSGIAYNKRAIRENYQGLFFPASNFYVINLTYTNVFEENDAGASLYRDTKEYMIEIKNDVSPHARLIVEGAQSRRVETGIGSKTLRLVRNSLGFSVSVSNRTIQITPRITYLSFKDRESLGEGYGVVGEGNLVLRQQGKGEIRFITEVRSLTEKKPFTQPEYLVTEGRRFGLSGLLGIVANYELSQSLRLTLNMTDRVYENRPAEFVGRGELIARF